MNQKQKILRIVEENFFQRGIIHRITIDEISSKLGMSKKTIYKHFPSKEALISEMIKNFTSKIKNQIESVLEKNDSAVVKIKNFILIIGAIASKVNDEWLFTVKNLYPDIWKYIEDFRNKMIIKNISKIIEQGKKEGLVVDIPTQIIINVFTGAVRNVVTPDFILNNNFSLQEAMKYTLTIFINGILTDKGKKSYKNTSVENELEDNFSNII
ncbi:TetR/AcrR family transcriptional regulator [Melioribacteraceae bacterium 4301-Me]|uniref:TetR/AcrR family transcriptional regulator n=1 Tax=Pyranulibacter aquaticus TaxID=3163344 RepID=UPI00359903FC